MKSVTMATKREMSDYTVFFSVLGHKKFIHKILAKSESVRFQPLFKFFWCSQRIALNISNMPIFLLKKCVKLLHCKSFSHFFNKNFSVFGYKVVKHLTS